MSAVKCGCDIVGVVYMKKEDPSARGILDGRITFHWVSMKKFSVVSVHVVRYVFVPSIFDFI